MSRGERVSEAERGKEHLVENSADTLLREGSINFLLSDVIQLKLGCLKFWAFLSQMIGMNMG